MTMITSVNVHGNALKFAMPMNFDPLTNDFFNPVNYTV